MFFIPGRLITKLYNSINNIYGVIDLSDDD